MQSWLPTRLLVKLQNTLLLLQQLLLLPLPHHPSKPLMCPLRQQLGARAATQRLASLLPSMTRWQQPNERRENLSGSGKELLLLLLLLLHNPMALHPLPSPKALQCQLLSRALFLSPQHLKHTTRVCPQAPALTMLLLLPLLLLLLLLLLASRLPCDHLRRRSCCRSAQCRPFPQPLRLRSNAALRSRPENR
jgi:hypothetical protein